MAQVLIDFHLDETKIQENAEREAASQIVREMFRNVYGGTDKTAMKKYVISAIEEILNPEKDEIIAEAVKEIVANLHRTKAVKELLNDATKDT